MSLQQFFSRIFKTPSPPSGDNPPSVDQDKDDTTPDNCKILFRFYSDVLERWTVETLWATAVDEKKGWYRLDSIPFYVMFIACDDIVFAEFDPDEQFLTFRELVTPSGNSTIQVVIMNPSIETNSVRDQFNALGSSSEKFRERYFVLNVPAQLSYAPVIALLDDLFEKGTIDYAEACLSENHRDTAD
jgi:Domain of unknown function (DUF4265)